VQSLTADVVKARHVPVIEDQELPFTGPLDAPFLHVQRTRASPPQLPALHVALRHLIPRLLIKVATW
jgi:hypothetical protein